MRDEQQQEIWFLRGMKKYVGIFLKQFTFKSAQIARLGYFLCIERNSSNKVIT